MCKRGVKLNFHWLDVRDPAVVLRSGEWSGESLSYPEMVEIMEGMEGNGERTGTGGK